MIGWSLKMCKQCLLSPSLILALHNLTHKFLLMWCLMYLAYITPMSVASKWCTQNIMLGREGWTGHTECKVTFGNAPT
jgi:hypothetical protein